MTWRLVATATSLPHYELIGGLPGPNGTWNGTKATLVDWTRLAAWVTPAELGITPVSNGAYCVETTIITSKMTAAGSVPYALVWMCGSEVPWPVAWGNRISVFSGFHMSNTVENTSTNRHYGYIFGEGGAGYDDFNWTACVAPTILWCRSYYNGSAAPIAIPGSTLVAGDMRALMSTDGTTWLSFSGRPTTYWEEFSAAGVMVQNTGWGTYEIEFGAVNVYMVVPSSKGAVRQFSVPDWFTDAEILECLHPPQEYSQALDPGTMKTSQSSLDLVLEDIPDTDGLSYWGKVLAAARWDTGIVRELTMGTGPNQYVRADAAALEVTDATGLWASSGIGYIGSEPFSFSSVVGNALSGVIKGLYSATGGAFGRTYKKAFLPGEDSHRVSQYPMSIGGRRVVLYVTCVDPTTGLLHPEGEELVLWIGRIATDGLTIVEEGPTRRWRLGCLSLLAEQAKRKIGTDGPTLRIESTPAICIHGDAWSRTVRFDAVSDSGYVGYYLLTIPEGTYTPHDYSAYVTVAMNASVTGGLWSGTTPALSWYIGRDRNSHQMSIQIRPLGGWADAWTRIEINADSTKPFSHALQALGFDATKRHEVTLVDPPVQMPRYAILTGESPYRFYHPLGIAQNGGRLYVGDASVFWPTTNGGQGDNPHHAAGVVAIEECVLDPYSGIEGNCFMEYTSSGDDYLGIHRSLTEEFMEMDTTASFIGVRVGDDKQVVVKQAYVPFYYDPIYGGPPRGPFEMLLYPLLSTGTPGYNHATYDKLPLTLSLGVEASLVDIQSFLDADAAIMPNQLAHRKLWHIPAGACWLDLVAEESKLFGRVLREKAGQIGLANVLSPDVTSYDVQIDDSHGTKPVYCPDLVMEIGTIVNQYRIKPTHPILGTWPQEIYLFTDVLSRDGFELTKEIEIEHGGLYLREVDVSIQDVLKANFIWRPLRLISPKTEAHLDRTLICRLYVGDVVRYVNPRMMSQLGTGERGLDCLATVLDLNWNYSKWTGTCTLLLHTQYQSYGTPWAPGAIVDIEASNGGWDSTNKRLTLKALDLGVAGDPDDGSVFGADDAVLIVERAPVEPTTPRLWQATVASDYETDGAQLLTLAAGTTLAGWDADREYVVLYADWTQIQTSQKTHGTWQASVSTLLLDSGAGNDSPNRWG